MVMVNVIRLDLLQRIFATYFLMEVVSEYILEVEVLDKRHVGMKSSTMEKKALKNALKRLQNVLKVAEVCTDASSSRKKLVGNKRRGLICPC